MGAGCGESLHKSFWDEFCLSTLCGIVVVGDWQQRYYFSDRIFNCYLGDRYSLKLSPPSNKIID